MSNNNFDLQPNHLSQETVVSMRTRVIAGLVAAAIVLPFLFLGDYAFMALMAFVLSIAVLETIRCAKKKYSIWLYIVTFILALTITYWPIIDSLFRCSRGELVLDSVVVPLENWRPYVAFKGLALPISSLVVGVCALFILVVSDASFEVRDACYMFTMILVISLGIQSLMFLKFAPLYEVRYLESGGVPASSYFNVFDNFQSVFLFIYVVLATFLTDIGAYFVGVLFGKHKMNPRISPKKTWEGFFGGMIFSAVISFAIVFLFAVFKNPLLPFLDLNHWYYMVGLSLIIPPVSVLGDFVFSSIKRYYNIKDFGKLIPGHGGILDRIDSLVFSSMVAALFISLIIYWR